MPTLNIYLNKDNYSKLIDISNKSGLINLLLSQHFERNMSVEEQEKQLKIIEARIKAAQEIERIKNESNK